MYTYRRSARGVFSAILGAIALSGALAQIPTPLPVPEEPLSVDEAVLYALRSNPSVTLAEQNVDIAESQVDVARANRRPTIGITANGVWTPSPTEITIPGQDQTFKTGSEFTLTTQLSVSQPIWPPARWEAPIRQARAGVGLSEEALLRTRDQVAFQTRQAFYQLLTAQRFRDVARDAVTVAESQLRLAQATVDAGLAAPLDVFQARAILEDARVNLTRAENNVNVSRAALATQLGLPAGVNIEIEREDGLPSAPESADPLVEEAIANRPEVAQLRYRREQLEANIELIRLEKRPLVNVQANYNYNVLNGGAFGTEGLSVAAVGSFNFYNGGRTSAQLEAARTQLEQIDTNLRQLELGISLEVRQAWLNLRNALEQISAAQAQLAAANEALRIAEIRFQNGEGIFLEVEQARLQRTQAQNALAQAEFQAKTARAQLDFALSAPLPEAPVENGD